MSAAKKPRHLRLVEPCGHCGSVQCDGSCIEPCALCGASGCRGQCEPEEPELDEDAGEPVAAPTKKDGARERKPRDVDEEEGEPRTQIGSIAVRKHWYTTSPPPQPYLLVDDTTDEGVLPLGEVAMLVAAGGVGKTMAAGVQLAHSIATGLPWLNAWRPAKPGRVLFLAGEEKEHQLWRRLYYARGLAGHVTPPDGSIEVAPLAGGPCALLERIKTPKMSLVQETQYCVQLRNYVEKHGPWSLILVDPLSRFGGEEVETSNSWATQCIEVLESLVEASGGATLLALHHSSQWSRQQGNADAFASRGVTGLIDGARFVANMTVERNDDEDLKDAQLNEIIKVSNSKSNYGRLAKPFACRREAKYGGALVRLTAAEVEILEAAREDRMRNKKEEKQQKRDDARNAKEAEKCAREDAALDKILSQPDPPKGRALRDAMRGALNGCSSARSDAAVARRAARAARAGGTDCDSGTDGTPCRAEAQGGMGGNGTARGSGTGRTAEDQ